MSNNLYIFNKQKVDCVREDWLHQQIKFHSFEHCLWKKVSCCTAYLRSAEECFIFSPPSARLLVAEAEAKLSMSMESNFALSSHSLHLHLTIGIRNERRTIREASRTLFITQIGREMHVSIILLFEYLTSITLPLWRCPVQPVSHSSTSYSVNSLSPFHELTKFKRRSMHFRWKRLVSCSCKR